MKKLLLFAFPVLLLASCQHYDNTIGTREDDIYNPHYDSAHLVNGKPAVSFNTLYTVSPTWYQAFTWARKDGRIVWFWVGLFITAACIGAGYYFSQNRRDPNNWGFTLWFGVAILVGGPITGGSIEWEKWNMDKKISKQYYDQLIQKDGDLHEFWENIKP